MIKLLTANEAAEYLRISRITFWKMRKNCPLHAVKIGSNSVRYTEEELDRWVQAYDPHENYRNA